MPESGENETSNRKRNENGAKSWNCENAHQNWPKMGTNAPDIFQMNMMDVMGDLDFVLQQEEGESEDVHIHEIDVVLERPVSKGLGPCPCAQSKKTDLISSRRTG